MCLAAPALWMWAKLARHRGCRRPRRGRRRGAAGPTARSGSAMSRYAGADEVAVRAAEGGDVAVPVAVLLALARRRGSAPAPSVSFGVKPQSATGIRPASRSAATIQRFQARGCQSRRPCQGVSIGSQASSQHMIAGWSLIPARLMYVLDLREVAAVVRPAVVQEEEDLDAVAVAAVEEVELVAEGLGVVGIGRDERLHGAEGVHAHRLQLRQVALDDLGVVAGRAGRCSGRGSPRSSWPSS